MISTTFPSCVTILLFSEGDSVALSDILGGAGRGDRGAGERHPTPAGVLLGGTGEPTSTNLLRCSAARSFRSFSLNLESEARRQ